MFRLALRQAEGLIGSVIALPSLDLVVPDHSTLSRRAEMLTVPGLRSGTAPVHRLVDSTGLKLFGSGEWPHEKHGARTRRAWGKLHIGVDADTGRILAATLTTGDIVDAVQVGALLDQVNTPDASFTADGAYDQEDVHSAGTVPHPEASVIVPPRSSAVPSDMADTAPSQRDRHLRAIAGHGRRAWQVTWGCRWRALIEADVSRFKRVIGGSLGSRTSQRRTTEVGIAVSVLSRMLGLGRPAYVRMA